MLRVYEDDYKQHRCGFCRGKITSLTLVLGDMEPLLCGHPGCQAEDDATVFMPCCAAFIGRCSQHRKSEFLHTCPQSNCKCDLMSANIKPGPVVFPNTSAGEADSENESDDTADRAYVDL